MMAGGSLPWLCWCLCKGTWAPIPFAMLLRMLAFHCLVIKSMSPWARFPKKYPCNSSVLGCRVERELEEWVSLISLYPYSVSTPTRVYYSPLLRPTTWSQGRPHRLRAQSSTRQPSLQMPVTRAAPRPTCPSDQLGINSGYEFLQSSLGQ